MITQEKLTALRTEYVSTTGSPLKYIYIYFTTKCNSKCAICNIWKKTGESISLDHLRRIHDSDYLDETALIYFQGGEFLLHPEALEVIRLFSDKNTVLLSNGLATKKILRAVEEGEVKKIAISLDGKRESYERVRGIDGFDKVMATLEALKKLDVEVHLNYTINPGNTLEDFRWVKQLCQENNYQLATQVEYGIKYLDVGMPEKYMAYDITDDLDGPSTFLRSTEAFYRGEIRLPCVNINDVRMIYVNGDVPLCLVKDHIILGNVFEHSLDEIMNSEHIKEILHDHVDCNDCWLNCHRILDVKFVEWAVKTYGKTQVEHWFGEIRWPYDL